MQLNYSIPDVALVELMLYLTPTQLLSLAEGEPTGVQIVDDNLESVRKLLKSKEVIGRLCTTKCFTPCDTFEDYLLSYDYWHLDEEETSYDSQSETALVEDCTQSKYEWFAKRWHLTLGVKRALYIAARNAQKDIRFLTIVDQTLKENRLTCSEEHLYLVCRGLVWSRELQEKYLLPLDDYWRAHGRGPLFERTSEIIAECKLSSKYWTPHAYHITSILREGGNTALLETILESKSLQLDLEQSKLALRVLDWHDLRKRTLADLPRLEKITLACVNNDGRILRSLKPTLEEILEARSIERSALVENNVTREKFLDVVLHNPFHDDNHNEYFWYLGYKDFTGNKFRDVISETAGVCIANSNMIEYTPFYLCFYALGLDKLENGPELIKLFLPKLIRCFTNKVNIRRRREDVYYPEYLQFFAAKYPRVNREHLLATVAGDPLMLEWAST